MNEKEILREILYDAVKMSGNGGDEYSRGRSYLLSMQCMKYDIGLYVPIVMRPISCDSEGYNALYDYVDKDTESERSFILRPVCDVDIDVFQAFLLEKELNQAFPGSPHICMTLKDLCQELIQADTIEGLCIMAGDSAFKMSTDDIISLSISAQIPSRAW